MKRLFNFVWIVLITLTMCLCAFSTSIFAAGFEDSGEYQRYKKNNGEYAYSEFDRNSTISSIRVYFERKPTGWNVKGGIPFSSSSIESSPYPFL